MSLTCNKWNNCTATAVWVIFTSSAPTGLCSVSWILMQSVIWTFSLKSEKSIGNSKARGMKEWVGRRDRNLNCNKFQDGYKKMKLLEIVIYQFPWIVFKMATGSDIDFTVEKRSSQNNFFHAVYIFSFQISDLQNVIQK